MCNLFIVRILFVSFLPFLLEAGAKDDIYPKYVNMFGGEMITISSRTIKEDGDIYCEFGKKSVKAVKADENIRCVVPRLTARGIIPLRIKKDSKIIKTYILHVGLYLRSEAKKHLNLTGSWGETDVEKLSIKWNSTQLSENTSAKVDIVLVGYREHEQPIFKDLKILKSEYMNSEESFTFNTNDHRCFGNDCELYEIGMVEVRLRDLKNAEKYGYLTSYIKPLGWFFVDHMEKKYGKKWPSKKCDMWYQKDKKCSSWSEELLDCPCTLQQALTDFGRWQPDMSCSMFAGSKCKYHQGAVHCVRSFHPTKSGAGNQCCFSKDNIVRYAADSYNGSTPDRSHDWGGPVYDNAGFVPSLSHWVLDVVSLFYCCMWDNYESCDKYMELRATRDCKNYEPPRSATIFGSSDIYPFAVAEKDTNRFSFKESGKFWLINSTDFLMQGSFIKSESTLGLCGIALKEASSSTVEIYYNTSVLNVVVDREVKEMDTQDSKWQDLQGLTLIRNGTTQNNITVIMQSGVGVQIDIYHNRMRIIVAMPQKLIMKGIIGLLHHTEGTPNQTYIDSVRIGEKENLLFQRCDESLKETTVSDEKWFSFIQSAQTNVESCGLLDVPRSIKSNYNYSLDSEITITGCRKGTLSGDKTYTCIKGKDGNKWTPEITAKCKANTIQLSALVPLATVLWLVLQAAM